jgi:hypothetical protein
MYSLKGGCARVRTGYTHYDLTRLSKEEGGTHILGA